MRWAIQCVVMFALTGALFILDAQVAHADPTADLAVFHAVGVRAIPCSTEDAMPTQPCYWDAHIQGNGHGHSLVWWPSGLVVWLD